MEFLKDLVRRRNDAQTAAHAVLEGHEAAESRVVVLSQSFDKLSGLPVDIAEYYREALNALQVGCYRAAIVMSWAGFVYTLAETMVNDHQSNLSSEYSKWPTGSTEALLEDVVDEQIVEAAKKIGLIDHQTKNIYKGWLSTRNQCAHPTLYQPGRNVALGYIDAIISELPQYT